jgi:hypothetical protein
MTRNDWLAKRLRRPTRTGSIPALVASVSIHGVLVALIVAGVASSTADSPDAAPRPGIIGNEDYASGRGAGGAITPPASGPSLDPVEGARYVGHYLRPTPGQASAMLKVGLINDGEAEPHWTLTVVDGGGPMQKLVPITRDTFALQLAPRQRVVFRRLGDSVTAMSVRRGGDTTWAARVPSGNSGELR